MRYKKASYIANALFIVLASAFLIMIALFPEPIVKLKIGPGYYPALICILLITACVLSIVSTYRGTEDRAIEMPNIKNALLIIGMVILFLVFWKLTKMFYVVSFLAVGTLLFFLNPQPETSVRLRKALMISLCMQGFIYVVFQRLMYFNF